MKIKPIIRYRCPVCGYSGDEGLKMNMPSAQGLYCLNCWALWVDKHIPKLKEGYKNEHDH